MSVGVVFVWLLVLCLFYEIADWMRRHWGD